MKTGQLMYSLNKIICATAQALASDVATPAQKRCDRKFLIDKTHGNCSHDGN